MTAKTLAERARELLKLDQHLIPEDQYNHYVSLGHKTPQMAQLLREMAAEVERQSEALSAEVQCLREALAGVVAEAPMTTPSQPPVVLTREMAAKLLVRYQAMPPGFGIEGCYDALKAIASGEVVVQVAGRVAELQEGLAATVYVDGKIMKVIRCTEPGVRYPGPLPHGTLCPCAGTGWRLTTEQD